MGLGEGRSLGRRPDLGDQVAGALAVQGALHPVRAAATARDDDDRRPEHVADAGPEAESPHAREREQLSQPRSHVRRLHRRPELGEHVHILLGPFPELPPCDVDRVGRVPVGRLRERAVFQPGQQFAHGGQALPAPPGHARPDDVPEVCGAARDHRQAPAPAVDAEEAPAVLDVDHERLPPGGRGGDGRRLVRIVRHHRDVQAQPDGCQLQSDGEASGGNDIGIELMIHLSSMAIRLSWIERTA